MSRAIENLTKTVEEKDLQIANLMNKLESKKSEESKSSDMDDADEALKQVDTNEHPDASTSGGYKNKERNAFDWYTDLEPESIDCWEEMEREFQNRFYSTRRSVSMIELTNTKQRKEEHVVGYINRWRALSLDCKERLSEVSAVEMCMQGMHWGLLYILQGNKPRTFEELATRGHNMEITIASHGESNPPIGDPREDTREARWQWGSKATTEDSMVVTTTPLKKTDKHKKEKQDRNKNQPQGKESQWPRSSAEALQPLQVVFIRSSFKPGFEGASWKIDEGQRHASGGRSQQRTSSLRQMREPFGQQGPVAAMEVGGVSTAAATVTVEYGGDGHNSGFGEPRQRRRVHF
ncbi:hypothetical protein RJ640_015899 [Escallonia rubra]|uniref:Retrotransposon gag domain-containing protein n=1 Tax=Escallonia rubra TaxID=112253 RepID=A0AA88QV29_9ASTE|nr:hypothetical protein RJ640_015899 [Escallonia rubra]